MDNTTAADYPSMWQTETQSYRPILTMFGRYNSDPDADVEKGFAKLSCLVASEKDGHGSDGGDGSGSSGNSTSGGDGGDSAAMSVSRPRMVALVVLVAGVSILI
jgi:hypothetical protein